MSQSAQKGQSPLCRFSKWHRGDCPFWVTFGSPVLVEDVGDAGGGDASSAYVEFGTVAVVIELHLGGAG